MSRQWLVLVGLLICSPAFVSCGRSEQPEPTGPIVSSAGTPDDIFTNGVVLRIEIEIPRSGMSALRRTQSGTGDERPKAKATVREGGNVYHNVAVHLKGAAGSFRSVDEQPALTLNFDKFAPGQDFHGLHKISLNNSVQDQSYLSEKVCRELFDAAGVPVPRAGHALVKLNGSDLGLYVLLEGANKQFLKRYFSNAKGNLYDGGFVRDISDSMPVNCGENPEDHSGLKALTAALRETAQSNKLAPLEKAMDVDRFISMIAMEVMMCHWDGYALNKNNWRVFHDLESNRMVFIPHGVDQTFGMREQRDFSSLERMHFEGRVAGAIMRTGEGRRRFRERVGELYTNVFVADRILARVDEIEAGLRPALAQWDGSFARGQQREAARFKQSIARRISELRRQMPAPVNPIKIEPDSEIKLTEWKPSAVKAGNPALKQVKDAEGKVLLVVGASDGLSSGSWRTRAVLPEGRYRFQGRMCVRGVNVDANDPRSGGGLRISKGTMPRKLSGTTEWREFAYEFEGEMAEDVEFICELKALGGEAWFDLTSLRLVRLP